MHVETVFVRGAEHHSSPATGSCARPAPIGAKTRFSPSSRAPAPNSSVTRIRERAFSAKDRSPSRPAASPGAGASSTTRASSGPSIPPRASPSTSSCSTRTDRRRPNSSSDAPTTRSGRADLIARRLGLAALPEADLHTRFYETRAVEPSHALPSRWPFAFSPDGKSLDPDPSHAAPLGACHGERTRHGDDGLERRRGLLRLRQRPPERPDRLPVRQRDRRPARARSSICAISKPARPTRPALRRSSASDATHGATYEPGVATFAKTRGDLATGLCGLRPPGSSLRHSGF